MTRTWLPAGLRAAATRLARGLGGAARREDGAATVEFALLFPVFMFLFISTIESSILLMRQVMLERGVEIATRAVRLDASSSRSQAQLLNDICDEVLILPDCRTALVVELLQIDMASYDLPDTAQPCINREQSTNPSGAWVGDRTSALILMRACYASTPFMPLAGLGTVMVADRDGESLRLVVATAFRVEPE